MRKKTRLAGAACVIGMAALFVSLPAAQGEKPEDHSKGRQELRVNVKEPASWDRPWIRLPILVPGFAKGAGMMQEPLDEMDGSMEAVIADGLMPGAVALVARGGQVVKHKAYGEAMKYTDDKFTKAKQPIAMRKDTIFDLASISKLFTTTAAMKLWEENAFELDDPVSSYIPEFAQNGKEKVTVRQLMTHTSGFVSWIPLYTKGNSREDRLQLVFANPLANEPGKVYTYSDLNMITLGALVEKLSGERLDVYVKKHLTGPLGMKDTMYNPPKSLQKRIAAAEYQPSTGRGLVWGEVHDENAWSLDGVAGHAGVFSTASDLAKFAHMYLNDGRYGSKRILKPETVRLLSENQNTAFPGNDHGLGWELNQGWYMDALSEDSTLGHTGFTGTSIVVNRSTDTIAILLTNRVHPSRNSGSINEARRIFARHTADAIPVTLPGKEIPWFSGYGDQTEKILTAKVDLKETASLSYMTWHRIEAAADYGYLEVSADGETWREAAEPLTGNSGGWKKIKVPVAKEVKFIRFRYKTDSTVNGRGWYIGQLTLKEKGGKTIKPAFSGEGWTKRSY